MMLTAIAMNTAVTFVKIYTIYDLYLQMAANVKKTLVFNVVLFNATGTSTEEGVCSLDADFIEIIM